MLVNEKETTNRHLTAYNHLLVRTIEEKDALIEDMKEKIAALSRKQHASPASATVLSSACQMALEALHSAAGAFEVEKSWGDLQHFAHELYEKHEVFQGFVQQLGPAAVPEPATGSITALQRMCQQQGDQQQQSLALFGTDTGAMELARMIAGTKPGRGEVIITGLLARASFRAAVSIPCPEHLPVTILSGAPPSIDIDEKSLDQDAEQIIMSGDDVALILTAWRPVTTKSVKSAVGVILINGLPYVYVLQPPTRRLTLFGNESWHEVTAESIFHLVVEEAFSEDDQWKLTTATFVSHYACKSSLRGRGTDPQGLPRHRRAVPLHIGGCSRRSTLQPAPPQ